MAWFLEESFRLIYMPTPTLHLRTIQPQFSTAGHIVYLAGAPLAVFWNAKRQTLVTLSSTEAEFINLMRIASILREATCNHALSSCSSIQQMALNPRSVARTRHIDVKYKWII